jgi:hypothetical protein
LDKSLLRGHLAVLVRGDHLDAEIAAEMEDLIGAKELCVGDLAARAYDQIGDSDVTVEPHVVEGPVPVCTLLLHRLPSGLRPGVDERGHRERLEGGG